MAIHSDLPIYKVTFELLVLATELVRRMPRDARVSVGTKLASECLELVGELVKQCGRCGNGMDGANALCADGQPHLALPERHWMEWISVKDRMPESGKMVIVPGGVARWSDVLGWVTETGICAGCPIQWEVRWWMPFPKAPDE